MAGPLAGINIIEFAGLGPGPFCGMMLADQGATVTVLHRPGGAPDPRLALSRSRKLVEVDLKSADGIETARNLVKNADGVIEGFRPGVMERLGLGPDALLADNPQLIYGRMTGWGQYGPLAHAAGHDINYISISGALHAVGRAGDKPTPPLNMVGDFGGGGMMLALGMVSALLNAKTGGTGQVVDCAMTDGSAALMAMIYDFHNIGQWQDERGVNMLDTGAHFYDTYETSDGKFVSIGSIEPQFYAELRQVAGLSEDTDFDAQMDQRQWPALKEKLTALFKTKTRSDWCDLMEGTDICFAPVLSLTEAKEHPHNVERQTFVDVGGLMQPAPAPRYSVTVSDRPKPPV
ncbi:CaiB/BaiF CoA transferase family protein [Parasphingorhabdus sp.]|uniref:CaiB/BaiF CoA transferase family protein n=1 Tax=Parasphingorhabdus sp. TaxID=2709688 RepID=UPI003A910737